MGTLQQTGHRAEAAASMAPSFLSLLLLVLVFVISLLLAVGASAWFTRRLETIGDLFDLSPGLLSLLGALGANIPNYVSSFVAAASGQCMVGLGIILGSNIYNMAIILGISTFAAVLVKAMPCRAFAAKDVRAVAASTLAIMLTTLPLSIPVSVVLLTTNLLSLGLFCVLAFHALPRVPHGHPARETPTALINEADPLLSGKRRMAATCSLGEAVLALVLALGGVIVMVQTGQAFAVDIHLSQAILGLVVLAVATSLPNTVVAFTLARTDRASACVEEVLSSNSINATLGIALPLLLWQPIHPDPGLLFPNALLMVALTLTALIGALRQRVSRLTGFLLVLVYVSWVVVHAFA
jgi:cation:H+ antiporter